MPKNEVEIRTQLKDQVKAGYKRMAGQVKGQNKQIQTSMKQAEKASMGFGGAVKKLIAAAAGFVVFRKVNSLIRESIRLFDIQAKAEKELATALGYTSQALLDQASALQRVTLYGDEATIHAQALIAAFVKEEDQILKIMPLVQDLATAKKMDLAVAADLVSKTLGSSTNALSRYGIQVEGTVGSTERLNDLMEGLTSHFEGQAQAAAKAGAGGLLQFQMRMDDIKETLGEEFLSVVMEVVQSFEQWATAGKKAEDLQKRFRQFADVARIVIGVIQDMINAVVGFFQLAASVVDKQMGKILMRMADVIGEIKNIMAKLPQKFVPDSWMEGIQKAETGLIEFGKASILAGKDLWEKGIGNLLQTGKAIEAWKHMGETAEKTAEQIQKIAVPKAPAPVGLTEQQQKQIDQAQALQDQLYAQSLQGQERELEQLSLWYAQKEEILIRAGESTELLNRVFMERAEAITDKYHQQEIDKAKEAKDEKKAIDKASIDHQRTYISQFLGNLNTAAGGMKKFAALQKIVAVAETGYSTYLSAQKMFEAGTKFPPPANLVMPWILSGAAVTAGLARIAAIEAFAEGGVQRTPAFATIAERGPEAIIPLKGGAVPVRMEGGTGTRIENVNINISGMANAGEIADTVEERLRLFQENQFESTMR